MSRMKTRVRTENSVRCTVWLALTWVCAACGGGGDSGTIPSTVSTVCGYELVTQRLDGTVSHVQDGDTITVNGMTVRLDSIDAPELAQSYGPQSQAALSALVLGKTVKVAYAKTDRYGRVVGSVFTSSRSAPATPGTTALTNARSVQQRATSLTRPRPLPNLRTKACGLS